MYGNLCILKNVLDDLNDNLEYLKRELKRSIGSQEVMIEALSYKVGQRRKIHFKYKLTMNYTALNIFFYDHHMYQQRCVK